MKNNDVVVSDLLTNVDETKIRVNNILKYLSSIQMNELDVNYSKSLKASVLSLDAIKFFAKVSEDSLDLKELDKIADFLYSIKESISFFENHYGIAVEDNNRKMMS